MPRNPYTKNAGYVTAQESRHPKLPGHFVIYDRNQPGVDVDADDRWIVMHEPSSYHVSCTSLRVAREVMTIVADGGDDYDFGQHEVIS
ncbi:MAG: hypothetical protein E6Q97_37780 [Desulfurellales bacterium]|nr:MAG: hypothetical protein E6Q97_37780 [Desulfurellales bacterium]